MQSIKGTVHTKAYLFLVFSSCILISCSIVNDGEEVPPDCYLEEIRFDQFNSLSFETLSGGRIYRMSREFTVDGETNILDSYKFDYFKDSLAVIDQGNTTSGEPYLSIRFDEDKPLVAVRYFYSAGVKLFHHITYLQDDQIRIDLSRLDSRGDLLYVGYSLYYMNADGNVIRNERFRADPEDSTSFTKIEDRSFTYDRFQSPQEELFLPYFSNPNFPDVKFFSQNNILSYTENGQNYEFEYEYGPDNNVISQALPSGQLLTFSYANCSEE